MEDSRYAEARVVSEVVLDGRVLPGVVLHRQVVQGSKLPDALRTFLGIEFGFENIPLAEELFLTWVPPSRDLGDLFLKRHAAEQILDPKLDGEVGVHVCFLEFCLDRLCGGNRGNALAEADQPEGLVARVDEPGFGHLFQPLGLQIGCGLEAGLPPAVPHVLGIPVRVDV